MRILVSGGEKSNNIVNGVAGKFESSNDQFIVVEFLDNINEIYSKGDYYDKALITEQSITREYSITDEYEIRRRINEFALSCAQRINKQSFVFFTQDETLANIIYEEILPIEKNSVVVLAKPPYSVVLFYTIIVNDVNQIPSDLVFVPQVIQNEFTPIEDTTSEFDDTPVPEDINVENLFGGDFDNYDLNTGRISDEVGIETGDSETFEGDFEGDFGGDGFEGDFEGDFGNEGFEGGFGGNEFEGGFGNEFENADGFSNEFTGDSFEPSDNEYDTTDNEFSGGISLDKSPELEMSGEIPNYVIPEQPENEFDMNNSGLSLDKNSYNMNNNEFDMNNSGLSLDKGNVGIVPGFDDEPEYDNNNTDLYGNYTPEDRVFDNDVYDNDPENIPQPMDTQGGALYGFDDYTDTPQEIPNNNATGFDDDDYSTDGNQMNPAMLAAGAIAGMGMIADEMGQYDNNMQPQVQPGAPAKKPGLFGKGGKQKDNVPQNNGAVVNNNASKANVKNIATKLKTFANKGNSIVFTGCGGCGTSTMAYSVANVLNQLGYTVLLVDFDTEGKTQSYMTRAAYDSMETDSANLMSAVNSSTGISNYTSILKEGFHLLTMGIGANTAPVQELLHKEKLNRFVNVVKTSYNFVIYDIPFDSAVGFLSDIVYMSDNTVLVTDASNWGVTKTMISMCNIASEEMMETMFRRAQIVFNRYRRLYKVFGRKVKTCNDITKVMDEKVYELTGEDLGLHFDEMRLSGIVNDTPEMEDGWFADVTFSDTAKGQQVFLKLIESIILE